MEDGLYGGQIGVGFFGARQFRFGDALGKGHASAVQIDQLRSRSRGMNIAGNVFQRFDHLHMRRVDTGIFDVKDRGGVKTGVNHSPRERKNPKRHHHLDQSGSARFVFPSNLHESDARNVLITIE